MGDIDGEIYRNGTKWKVSSIKNLSSLKTNVLQIISVFLNLAFGSNSSDTVRSYLFGRISTNVVKFSLQQIQKFLNCLFAWILFEFLNSEAPFLMVKFQKL